MVALLTSTTEPSRMTGAVVEAFPSPAETDD